MPKIIGFDDKDGTGKYLSADLFLDEYLGSGLSLDVEYDDGERYSSIFIDGEKLKKLYGKLKDHYENEEEKD